MLVGLIGGLLIVGLLAGALALLLSAGLLQNVEALHSSQACSAAETGLTLGKAYVSTNSSWYRTVPYTITGTIGRATFTTVVETTNYPCVTITSEGRRENSQWTSIWTGATSVIRGMLVYRDTGASPTVPRVRDYMQSGQVSDEQNALSTTNAPQWIRLAVNPKTNEYLMVVQDSSRWIRSQTCSNGAWCANTLLNSAGTAPFAADRGFDVAYEQNSGRALAVYSVGTTTLQYRIWNSTNWSAPGSINVGALFPVAWVRLAAKPDSNEIMMLARWRKSTNPRGNYTSAVVWNGSAWGNLQPLEVLCGSSIDCESMDASYSTNNQALVLYVNGAADINNPKYRTWSGSSWSTQCVMTALSGTPQWMRLQFSPNGTNAYAAFLDSGATLNGTHWTGSTWGAYTNFGGISIESTACRDFDMAWCSQSNMIMVVYCQRNTAAHSYMTQTVGAPPSFGSLPAGTTDGRWSVLRADPKSGDFVYMAIDDTSDVNIYRWHNSAWSLIGELETASDTSYSSIDFRFRLDQ